MSYDVWVEAEFKNGGWHQLGDNCNITYNLAKMFTALIGTTPNDWDGISASAMIPDFEHGINELIFRPDEYKQFESPHGWGTVEGCRQFLMEVLGLCREYPFAILRVG